jgi:hypothetical protein
MCYPVGIVTGCDFCTWLVRSVCRTFGFRNEILRPARKDKWEQWILEDAQDLDDADRHSVCDRATQ